MEDSLAPLPVANVAGLTPLDLATGHMLGTMQRPDLARPRVRTPLREILLEAKRRHLADAGTNFVAYSGGRDSAMDLALATRAARLYGYPDPVPVTLRYTTTGSSDDEAVQELVVRHLALADWERVEIADEHQVLGPVAQRTLRKLGPLWPANAYTLLSLMERARDGVFTLPNGATDFFAFWRWAPLADVLAGHRRPNRTDLTLLATSLLPPRARAAAARRNGIPARMPWLRPEAERRALELIGGRMAVVPLRFDRAMRTQRNHRCGDGAARSLQALADEAGTRLLQPVNDPDCVGAIATTGGWRGFGSKSHFLEAAAGDLLPAEALRRRKPPNLQPAFFGEHTRRFAERWSGGGLDESLVDPDRLRSIWLEEGPDWRTAGLMQVAWLHDEQANADGAETAIAIGAG